MPRPQKKSEAHSKGIDVSSRPISNPLDDSGENTKKFNFQMQHQKKLPHADELDPSGQSIKAECSASYFGNAEFFSLDNIKLKPSFAGEFAKHESKSSIDSKELRGNDSLEDRKGSGHNIVEDYGDKYRKRSVSIRSVTQSLSVLHKEFGRTYEEKIELAEDVAREITGDYKVRCPISAPILWKAVEKLQKNPAEFARLTYAYYRMNGMLLSDLFSIDPYLYKKFTSWCYYRKLSPKEVFESRDAGSKETVSQKAISDGILAEDAIQCPKKSEIGKSITEAEYRHLRRKYENQLSRIRRSKKPRTPSL